MNYGHFDLENDVSNVVFTSGAVVREDGSVYIYHASSDTRLHVATSTKEESKC